MMYTYSDALQIFCLELYYYIPHWNCFIYNNQKFKDQVSSINYIIIMTIVHEGEIINQHDMFL